MSTDESYNHIVALCEGKLDKYFLKEVTRRLYLRAKALNEGREGYRQLQQLLRRLDPRREPIVIIFPGGSLQKLAGTWLHRVVNCVIDINRYARTHLVKVLAFVDQHDAPSPAGRADLMVRCTINSLRALWSSYKPSLRLRNSISSRSSNHIDKLIGRDKNPYAKTTLRVVAVDCCLECELLRILEGKVIFNEGLCHKRLREEIKKRRGYPQLVSVALDILERSSPQPLWYYWLKEFMRR